MQRSSPPLTVPVPPGFLWATGIEDTFIAEPRAATGRTLDEYELTEHYARWEEDLRLIAELGVSAARYGIPWYRVERERGRFDWSWTDQVLDRMVNTHHVEPIIDLVHYGTPLWLERSFLNPDYPRHVAEYAAAFAEHYRGLCYWFTPLNEPRVNAWYSGRLGWWPPYGRSWRAFAQVLVQLAHGICLTQQAISAVESAAVFCHVDATDLYVTEDPTLEPDRELRQNLVFLALDLVTGRVDGAHPLRGWLSRQGIPDPTMDWFAANAVHPHVVGYNMYPMYSLKVVLRTSSGIRVRIRPCWSETLLELTRLYAARFPGLPLMVTETASSGPVSRRIRWVEDSVAAVNQARAEGIPVVGYTYWPLFSLVTWAYQRGSRDLDRYLLHMGLWDLKPGPTGLERVPTAAAGAYRRAVQK